jgi:hypothetical protein
VAVLDCRAGDVVTLWAEVLVWAARWRWLTAGACCGHARWVDERVVIGAGPAGLLAWFT